MNKEKVVIITGGSRGIGRGIVRTLANKGYTVFLNYLNSEIEAQKLFEEFPDNIKLLKFDVSKRGEVIDSITKVLSLTKRIDYLINSAGILETGFLIRKDISSLEKQVNVNFWGPLFCSNAVLPTMIEQKKGLIINISSVASIKPVPGQIIYSASKAALEALTRGIAVEYASKGVRCLTLRLGPIDTDMFRSLNPSSQTQSIEKTLLKRVSKPEEVGNLIASVMEETNSFFTGSILEYDGGYLLS